MARKRFQNFEKILHVSLSISKYNIINAKLIIGETSNFTVMTKANGYIFILAKVTNIRQGENIKANLLSRFSFTSENPIDFSKFYISIQNKYATLFDFFVYVISYLIIKCIQQNLKYNNIIDI